MQMKKLILSLILVALIGTVAYLTLDRQQASQAQALAQSEPQPTVLADPHVIVEGKVVPVTSAELRFTSAGVIRELLVKEGDKVTANTPLARLDTRELELRVAQAQAQLDQAKAQDIVLETGAAPEEIAVAKAQVARSLAQLRAVGGDVTTNDLAAAKARQDQARAHLAQLVAGPTTPDRQVAQAQFDQANTVAAATRDSLSVAKTHAQADMEKAANDLRDKQDAYNQIYWDNQRASAQLAKAPADIQQQAKDREAAALRAMQNAQHDLEQARVGYQNAQQAEVSGIDQAQAGVREAQANLDKLMAGADADQLANARAEVAQAEANYAKMVGDQRAGNVGAAQAESDISQAELTRLTAGPRTIDLAAAKANVAIADVALKQAQLALTQATLVAPMNGTVVLMNLKVGEAAGPTDVAAVVADLTQWQIETTDLTELKVAKIQEQAPATITFDALPQVTLDGTVSRIKQRGENLQGDISYVAIIIPRKLDPQLRWNMTASVSIQAK